LLGQGWGASAQGSAAPADGAKCQSFEECYRQAIKLYKAEQIPEALAAFEAAYSYNAEPNLLINIGRAHFRLGRAKEALDYYQRFLSVSKSPDAAVRARVEQYIAEAQKALPSAAPAPSTSAPPAASTDPAPPAAASFADNPAADDPAAKDEGAKVGKEAAATAAASPPVAALATAGAPPPAPAPAEARPIYKRWWFWTVIGVVVAGGVTAGVVAGSRPSTPDYGGIDVRKLSF
jgi:tetratricopeptide (TPR) repeat protein